MMKLLFLDVDGVLNDGYRGYPFILEHCLRCLKFIIDETKAQVVLSSNWRLFNEYRGFLMPKLLEHGIVEKDVFGSTPDLDLDHLPLRPREVLQWIRDNTTICPWQKNKELPQIHHFVVIDDRNLIGELYGQSLKGKFVQTNGTVGLTMDIAKRVVTLLNQSPRLHCMSTWALNHWPIFHEFDHVTYVQTQFGYRVVDNRVCQEKVYTPLSYFPVPILNQVLSFLSISDIASISTVSRQFRDLSNTSNQIWQPLYNHSLKKQTFQKSSSSISSTSSSTPRILVTNRLLEVGRNRPQSWPLSAPIEGYYKVACALMMVNRSPSHAQKNSSVLLFIQKFLSTFSNPLSLEANEFPCPTCQDKNSLVTASIAISRYGLAECDMNKIEFSRPPKRLQKKKKVKRFYCEAEVKLLAILKWGSFCAIRKRRASWQTNDEELLLTTDSICDGRKAMKLLQNLKLFTKQKLD